MKWVMIENRHINMNNVNGFFWENGQLVIVFNGDQFPARFKDQNQEKYLKLCHVMGVRPYEESEV